MFYWLTELNTSYLVSANQKVFHRLFNKKLDFNLRNREDRLPMNLMSFVRIHSLNEFNQSIC